LVGLVGGGVVALGADDDVVLGSRAVGAVVGREVGDAKEELSQFVFEVAGLGLGLLLVLAERPALLAFAFAGGLVALFEGLADFLGEGVDARADLVARGDGLAVAPVEFGLLIEHRRVDAAAGQALLEDVELGAQAPGVEHGVDGSVLWCQRLRCANSSCATARWLPSTGCRSPRKRASWWPCSAPTGRARRRRWRRSRATGGRRMEPCGCSGSILSPSTRR